MARKVVLRSRMNQVSGWFLAFGLFALMVGIDILHLYSVWTDEPTAPWYSELGYYAYFCLFGLGGFAVFGRPRVEITEDAVDVRNVLRDVRIPLHAIDDATTDGKYLVITAGGRTYRAAGTESPNIQAGAGISASAAEQVMKAVECTPRPGTGDDTAVVETWRRRPETTERILIALYLSYPILAATASALHLTPGASR